MKKYLLMAALYSFCVQAFCQSNEAFKTDSMRLDSLKKILPLVKGNARVDLLNSIAVKTLFNAGGSPRKRIDSSLFYSSLAYKEASKLNYKPGLAMALVSLGGTESGMNQPVKDEAAKEVEIRKALHLGEELNNNEIIGLAYGALGYLPSIRKDFYKHNDYWEKAIHFFLLTGDTLHAAEIVNWFTGEYESRGEYETAFDYAKQSIELSTKASTDLSVSWRQFLIQFALMDISDLYADAGDYESALNYIKENARFGRENNTSWQNFAGDIANLYCQSGSYDSAMIYVNQMDTQVRTGLYPLRLIILSQIYVNGTKQFDKAVATLKYCIDTVTKYHTLGAYATTDLLVSLGQAYDGEKQYNRALLYVKKGLLLASERDNRPVMMHGYQVLSTVYHHLDKNDSAYDYLIKYNALKDSIQNKKFLLRIYNAKKDVEEEKKQAQLGFFMKDNKIKKQQLKQEAMKRDFLLIFLFVLVATGFFLFRNLILKRKNDKLQNGKQQAELQERATRLEMQALRAQMNPHFIFNCLSSINCFILENETGKASDYLTRFSRLIRMVLTNSEKPLVTLDEELKMLKLYLDMERLRFENSFDYNITYTNDVEAESVLVPSLLLQPFCENAIWHGLRNKEGQGHLTLTIFKENEFLNCIITDDGIGRSKAGEVSLSSATKERSMGLKITTDRLSLFNEDKEVNTFFEINDVFDYNGTVTGTKVSIKIRYKQLMGAVA